MVFSVVVEHNSNRLRRFTAFLDVEGNKQSGTYQLYQSMAAFAAGGTAERAGPGPPAGQLPAGSSYRFHLAVVGEELGLWYTLGVVLLFGVIFVAGILHLRRAPNLFHFLLAAGCLLLICLQALINLGVVTGVFPTKGMSLPFISAGLSNLLLMGMLVGILLNTGRTWGRVALGRESPLDAGGTGMSVRPHPLPHFLRRHGRAPLARHRAGRGASGARPPGDAPHQPEEGRCAAHRKVSAASL